MSGGYLLVTKVNRTNKVFMLETISSMTPNAICEIGDELLKKRFKKKIKMLLGLFHFHFTSIIKLVIVNEPATALSLK